MNLKTPQALSYVRKIEARSHWELCRNSTASEKYVLKDDTRVDGPWEFGTRPVENQNKKDIEVKRKETSENNKKIAELGPVAATDLGYADITRFY